MDEDGIPEVLTTERMGRELPGMHGIYGRVSLAMRPISGGPARALGRLAPGTCAAQRALGYVRPQEDMHALYGDWLYDAAWLIYWRALIPQRQDINIAAELECRDTAKS